MFDAKYIIDKVRENSIYKSLLERLPEDERKKVEARMSAYAHAVTKSVIEPVVRAKVDKEQMEKIRKELDKRIKAGQVTSEKHGTPVKPDSANKEDQ